MARGGLEGWKGLGGPPGGLGGVVRPFWRAGRGHEGWERSRVSPGGLRGYVSPTWRPGRGREALPEV